MIRVKYRRSQAKLQTCFSFDIARPNAKNAKCRRITIRTSTSIYVGNYIYVHIVQIMYLKYS